MFGVNVKKFKEISLHHNFKNIDFYKNNYYNVYEKNVEKWPDQDFLRTIIYPIIKNDNLSHISYDNLRYSERDIMISPCPNNFIGLPIFL
jgi:hypothetical protein